MDVRARKLVMTIPIIAPRCVGRVPARRCVCPQILSGYSPHLVQYPCALLFGYPAPRYGGRTLIIAQGLESVCASVQCICAGRVGT